MGATRCLVFQLPTRTPRRAFRWRGPPSGEELRPPPPGVPPRGWTRRLQRLCDAAAAGGGGGAVADVGCGHGRLALALASGGGASRVFGVDRSPHALAVAQENLARLGPARAAVEGRLTYVLGDGLAALRGEDPVGCAVVAGMGVPALWAALRGAPGWRPLAGGGPGDGEPGSSNRTLGCAEGLSRLVLSPQGGAGWPTLRAALWLAGWDVCREHLVAEGRPGFLHLVLEARRGPGPRWGAGPRGAPGTVGDAVSAARGAGADPARLLVGALAEGAGGEGDDAVLAEFLRASAERHRAVAGRCRGAGRTGRAARAGAEAREAAVVFEEVLRRVLSRVQG